MKQTKHPLIAFTHIEKAAGTTLIHILRKNFFGRYLDIRPMTSRGDCIVLAEDIEIAQRILPRLACIGGHAVVPFGDMAETHPSMRFITLVRDPIKRYISHYNHWVEKKGLPITFDEFLQHDGTKNFQVKKIAGEDNTEKAIQIIRDRFILVGCVEQFDAFLIQLTKLLGWSIADVNYSEQNQASNTSHVAVDLDRYMASIVECNKNDLALYSYIQNELLPSYAERYGTEKLSKDLGTLRWIRLNRKSHSARHILDYAARKLYFEPFTGLVRMAHRLPYRGSY